MRVSPTHKQREALYKVLCRQFKEENPECQVKAIGCQFHTHDVHHMNGRGLMNGHDYMNDVSTFLPVCRSCHVKIETNPRWAKDNGYTK